jgi:hypothetical protein
MSSRATPPVPPRPDLSPEDRAAGWAVSPPERPGVTRRALEIWIRTLGVAVPLTLLLQGIPALLTRVLTPRTTGPNVISIWLRTGHLPTYAPATPPATPNLLVIPLSLLAAIVLVPLLYMALLRLMLGSSIGEPSDARRALTGGRRRLGAAIVVGLCVTLVLTALLVPLGVGFAILVTVHLWKLGIAVGAVGLGLATAIVSLSLVALLVEGVPAFKATGRSWRLAWRSPRAVILPVGALTVLVTAAAVLPGFVVPNLMSAGGTELLVEGLVTAALGAFTTPLSGAFITSAYLEARAAAEGIEPWTLASVLRASDVR